MGKLFSEFKCLLLLDAARHVCYKVLHVKCSMMATACCNCCLSCMLQIRTGCVEQQRSPGSRVVGTGAATLSNATETLGHT